MHEPSSEGSAQDGPTAPERRGRGELVLVVDDEELLREVLRSILEASGYQVVEAASGAEALDVVTRPGTDVDLVITDMTMPGMDGLATVEALRAVGASVPVVLISGRRVEDLAADAEAIGVRHVLPKPFTIETVLAAIEDVLPPSADRR